jgi:dTMP kinase
LGEEDTVKARYAVVEGPDGSGKGEQVRRLQQALQQLGLTVETVVEPGGVDRIGQILRSILKGVPEDPIVQMLFEGQPYELEPLTDLLLFNAARAQLMAHVAKRLQEGVWVLADRNALSSLAHQGYGNGQDLQQVEQLGLIATQAVEPDLIVVLDAPYEVLERRIQSRGTTDRFEGRGPGYLKRVHAGYQAIANERNIPIINADQPIERVHQDIWAHVEPLLKEA